MRVIITGGTGLIGRAVANRLADGGHEVVVLSRNTHKTAGLDGRVTVHGWDARSAHGWGHLADGAGAIINLAGESIAGEGFPPARWTAAHKRRVLESRLGAAKAITEAISAAKEKPAVLIQSSAVGYYGTHGDQPIAEDHPAGNDFLAETCVKWEASTQAVEAMGVRRVLIRTGIVLSTKGGVLPLMSLPFQLFAGGPIGSGQQQIPWIHIDDEIAAIDWLIQTPEASGAFNLSAPNPASNAEFGKALARVLKRPYFLPAPGFAFKLAFGEMSMLLLEGQRALPERLQAMGYTFQHSELEGALRDLYTHQK